MFSDFIIPFLAISLAEFGDKTQLAVLCLASKTKKHLKLLLGVMLAFSLADGIAIIFGDIISKHINLDYIKIGAGIIFIAFGIINFININKEEDAFCSMKTPFLSGFSLIFISELGDKTQIASALFAARFNPVIVFISVMLSLFILSFMAIFAGKILLKYVSRKTISIFAGALFIIIGILSLLSARFY